MEKISVFDIFKIGIGPSSSHTMGPWKAALAFLQNLDEQDLISKITKIDIHLFGSLAKTGKGHATDKAIMLGLTGADPAEIDEDKIPQILSDIEINQKILLLSKIEIDWKTSENLIFNFKESLPLHPNGMIFTAYTLEESTFKETYYSIGGGFIIKESNKNHLLSLLSSPFHSAQELLNYASVNNGSLSDYAFSLERTIRSDEQINHQLSIIWNVMKESIFAGFHKEGLLPGNLNVQRRAPGIYHSLLKNQKQDNMNAIINVITNQNLNFSDITKWISCFALAVNEQNASFSRVVTAPTNGAAGVIPAVLTYYICFCRKKEDMDEVVRFLLTSSLIATLFKAKATISAAQGGCQAEIGVSSAMAAAGLTELLGGTPAQCLMAAEIAMEHHLGMTCDPIGGLVQIPCIERNAMGAMKAITASQLALQGDPAKARVSLDQVIKTMWETAQDMSSKYKETAEGGLAMNVSFPEC